jgi:DNA-binding LacI/PurR family transcriptional regulator/AraC-like DNA-binding protein
MRNETVSDHARSEKTISNKIKPIAFLMNHLNEEYASRVFSGVQSAAQERNARLFVLLGGSFNNPYFDNTSKNAVFSLARSKAIQGIIALSSTISTYTDKTDYTRFLESFAPVPIVSIGLECANAVTIAIDNRAGMMDLVRHLAKTHGYRRIALLCGPETSVDAEARFSAYKEALGETGIGFDETLVVRGSFHASSGQYAVKELLDSRKAGFDCLIASNDYSAMRAISELRNRGIRVPEDIAVAGFDNITEAQYADISLTTVDQYALKLGYTAVHKLLSLIDGNDPGNTLLASSLVVRGSCGCDHEHTPSGEKPHAEDGDGTASNISSYMHSRLAPGVPPGEIESFARRLADCIKGDAIDDYRTRFIGTLGEGIDLFGKHKPGNHFWPGLIHLLFEHAFAFYPEKKESLIPLFLDVSENVCRTVLNRIERPALVSRVRGMELSSLKKRLGSVLDAAKLSGIARDILPFLGVRQSVIYVMKKRRDDTPEQYERIVCFDAENDHEMNSPGDADSGEISIIDRLCGLDTGYLFFIQSLVHARACFGYVCYGPGKDFTIADETEIGNLGTMSDVFTNELSAAVKSILLLREMRENAELIRESDNADRDLLLKYEKLNLSEEKGAEFFRELLTYMNSEKPFINENLTLPELALKLNISRNHLSFIINEYSGVNFYEFINTYRVEYAMRLLEEAGGKQKSVLEVAFMSGFRSKSTFNKIFKKYTGHTPKLYKKK